MSRSICLCMIVRNEEAVIKRALESARPYVDSWSIVDTGSQDRTIDIINETMAGLPGSVSRQEWVDFGANRTAALVQAKTLGSDYILVMDADQTLEVREPRKLFHLTAHGYNIEIKHGNLSYPHPWLLKASCDWRWEGETHEYLTSDATYTVADLPSVILHEHADSHRRVTGAKLAEDTALLQRAYADDPKNPRVVFYLAQACADAGKWQCAVRHYQERVKLGGWLDEVWCAQYRTARIFDRHGTWEVAVSAYLDAYYLDMTRAESLFHLGHGYLARRKFELARMFLDVARTREKRFGALFLEDPVYDYLAPWAYAWSLRGLGKHGLAEVSENMLLASPSTPAYVCAAIVKARLEQSFGPLPV